MSSRFLIFEVWIKDLGVSALKIGFYDKITPESAPKNLPRLLKIR